MKIQLSPDQIAMLPVHDADLILVQIETSTGGEITVQMTIQIDPEETTQPFRDLGIITQIVILRFGKCHNVISNLLSYQERRETINNWQVVLNSEKIDRLVKSAVFPNAQFVHNIFELSGGSTIEIIADTIFIEGVD
jgi:hypothetical protein